MKWWYYPAMAALARGAWMLWGDVAGWVALGIILAIIGTYWGRHWYTQARTRRQEVRIPD